MSLGPMQAMFATTELLRQQRNAGFDDEEKRKKAKRGDEDRAFEMDERKRLVDTRAELEQAAAPAAVEPGIYQPEVDDEGNAMPANPSRAGVVNGRGYATMEEVRKAQAAHNAPEATTARMADVLMRRANPEGAQKLRTGAMNEKVAGLKLSDAQRGEAQAKYLDDLQKRVPYGNWDALSKFASDSAMDGADGAVKYEWRPTADGAKRELFIQAGDLPFAPTGTMADNTPEGFNEQLMHLQRIPADRMALHFQRKQDRADNQAYRAEMLKDKDEAAAQRKREFDERMTLLREQRAGRGAGGKGAAGEVDPEAKLKDRRDALSDFDKLLPPLLEDADDAARGLRTQTLAQADGIFVQNAEAGVTLTAPQIRAAMVQAADPAKRKVIRDADTGRMFEAVIVNGRPVIVGVVMGQQPAASPAATPAAEARPSTGPRATAAPASAQTQQPSMRELFALAQRADQEAKAKAAAAKRLEDMRRQAGGNKALTADDVAAAQKFMALR